MQASLPVISAVTTATMINLDGKWERDFVDDDTSASNKKNKS